MRHPEFSIVIPTRNRPRQLAECLDAIAALDFPREEFEVIVVDDGGSVPLEPVADACAGRISLTLLRERQGGPASARNRGIAAARGRYLAFIDDDCAPAPEWLGMLSKELSLLPDHLVGGRTVNDLAGNVYSAASQSLIGFIYGYYNGGRGRARFFASNNMAVAAAELRALGGFDPAFQTSEDRDLCDRWLLSGRRMTYVAGAVVHHRHALCARTFWRQHFGYGRGAFPFRRAHNRRSGDKIRVEPPRFYFGMLRHPFTDGTRRPLTAAGLLIMSQLASAAGFLCECAWNLRERRGAAGRACGEERS